MYVLGLDCGGSSTQALLTTTEGEPLGFGQGGPANFTVNGLAAVVSSVKEAVSQTLLEAGLDFDSLLRSGVLLALGVSGAARPKELETLKEAFLKEGYTQVVVGHDAAIALLGALSGADGVAVIAGTGSIAYGVKGANSVRVGGWGYLLGDEGSAFSIVIEALKQIMRGFDGRVRKDEELEKAALQYFQAENAEELVSLIYKLPLDRSKIGGFSKTITALAENGHTVSAKILAGAGQQLGRLALATLQGLDLTDSSGRVAACGGVFQAGSLLLLPMQEEIWRFAPDQEVTLPDFPPVVGAVFLGLQALGLEIKQAARLLRLRTEEKRGF